MSASGRGRDESWENAPVFGAPPPSGRCRIRPSAYALIRDGAGRLAVVRAPDGIYLPGGGIEPGESVEEALQREALEECGFSIRTGLWTARAIQFAESASEKTGVEKRSTFVQCMVDGEAVEPLEKEHELLWLEPETARGMLTHESHGWAIERWVQRDGPAGDEERAK